MSIPVLRCILLKKYMLTAFCSDVLEYEPPAATPVFELEEDEDFLESVSFCSKQVVS